MICLVLTIFANIFSAGWSGENEQTFLMVKPDGVNRRLVGDIIRRLERKGFQLVGLKLMKAPEPVLKEHYQAFKDQPFFKDLIKYMGSGPVVAMVWQGLGVVMTARRMLGETSPADSFPGTIRGDYGIHIARNVIHGSDSVERAKQEIELWFPSQDITSWDDCSHPWIYGTHK